MLDWFVVMPNHIHGIIIFTAWAGLCPAQAVGNIIGAYKSVTTKLAISDSNRLLKVDIHFLQQRKNLPLVVHPGLLLPFLFVFIGGFIVSSISNLSAIN